jgi:hypothetical protein
MFKLSKLITEAKAARLSVSRKGLLFGECSTAQAKEPCYLKNSLLACRLCSQDSPKRKKCSMMHNRSESCLQRFKIQASNKSRMLSRSCMTLTEEALM